MVNFAGLPDRNYGQFANMLSYYPLSSEAAPSPMDLVLPFLIAYCIVLLLSAHARMNPNTENVHRSSLLLFVRVLMPRILLFLPEN